MADITAQKPAGPTGGDRGKVDFSDVQWGSVEWTNLCMLYLRAHESRLPHPVLGDHHAAEAVARIDYDFGRIHRKVRPAANQFMVALRGVQFDTFMSDYLTRHPDAIVLHLGCGLHSRPFRLTIPEGTLWYDVDLPKVIGLRRQLYSETDTYKMIGSSVTEPAWIDQLPSGGPVLIAAEGLLPYLTPTEMTELLHRLLDRFDTGELIADMLSVWGPRLSKVIEWGTRNGGELEQWDDRLRLIDNSSIMSGYDRITLAPQRLLCRGLHVIPAVRNYHRLFRFAF